MQSRSNEVRLGVELRAADADNGPVIEGLLVPYNTPTVIAGAFRETISRGCFAKSIKEAARALPLLVQHKHDELPIGSSVAWEDREDGLWGRWAVADTKEARDVHGLIRDGHLNSLSVGFSPIKSDWEFHEPPELDSVVRREARLLEASVVSVGAYPEAAITLVRTGEGRPNTRTRYDAWKKYLDALRSA